MRVVSDTSPLCYLILLDAIDLVPTLFQSCVIPRAVDRELRHPGAPRPVRRWILQAPAWLGIESLPEPEKLPAELSRLQAGERQAILLAESLEAPLLLVDEKAARRVAEQRGLQVTGVLGVLLRAAQQGLIALDPTLDRLQATGFRVDRRLLEALRRRV